MVEPRFHERRRLPAAVRIAALLFAVATWVLVAFLVTSTHSGEVVDVELVLLVGVLCGIAVPWLLWTLSLDVTVDAEHLRFALRPFYRRSIPLAEIDAIEVAGDYRPLAEHLGWGWRWTPWAGWAYTLYGASGVRVALAGGARRPRRFLLGTGRPAELVAAVRG